MSDTIEALIEATDHRLDVLERIQERILWLAVRMVDHANHDRPKVDGIKVGGHQASSASMVSIMTALWFDHLDAADRVAVKPHASPVLHAINYLLGNLDARYLTELRAFGGLQPYPSRTKDPDPVDYSTGSVGLGAAAPVFGAVTSRYLHHRFGTPDDGRFVALVGDAELDEGNVWEAIADPVVHGLDNVLWVVDLNRQSLDRVVPGMKADRLKRMFAANDWTVLEAKYGHHLQAAFAEPGGDALRRHLDTMPNEAYQSLFTTPTPQLRERFLEGTDPVVGRLLSDVPDQELRALLTNLGGHDLVELRRSFEDADRTPGPAVVFAYTVKGWGLPLAGDPLNHAAMLTTEQVGELRSRSGLTLATEWDRFEPGTAEALRCDEVAAHLARPERPRIDITASVPVTTDPAVSRPTSTQEAFGRTLVAFGRTPELGERVVTTSPDVTVSTNLGGWVNKVGVFSPEEQPDYGAEGQLLRWHQSPRGQHLELGISEMNLFLLLGQLGLAGEHFGQPLVPIGTVYDPFVLRGLDAFIYGLYGGSRFIVAGTPSGVSLGYEGGAHQSVITPSVGMELPDVAFVEPAYATTLDWLLCDGVRRVLAPQGGESLYLRLSTKPIDQGPFEALRAASDEEALRADVLAGGYRLVDASAAAAAGAPQVHLVASGAVMPEVIEAARLLADEGVAAHVVDATSPDRLFRGWRATTRRSIDQASQPELPEQLAKLFPVGSRHAPVVTVHDAAPHTLSWLGAVFGVPTVSLGVETFGQAGSIPDLYRAHQIDAEAIVSASLSVLTSPAAR